MAGEKRDIRENIYRGDRMKINTKGQFVYVSYGSISNKYECLHCGQILTPPAKETIYSAANPWYKDGSGRIRCLRCGNLAERV